MISLNKISRPSLVKTPHVKINQHELLEFLMGVGGSARFVSVVMETEPQLVGGKSSPYHGRVKKRSKISGIVNFRYENSVNNQRIREGEAADFQSAPRAWGQHVIGTPLISHKGAYYLEVKIEKVLSSILFVDGIARSPESLAGVIRPASEQVRQGLDKEVILRDINLINIREITINQIHYTVR